MPDGTVAARGLTFAFLERGPSDGPLALVLHGFPDTPVSFVPLLEALGELGYRAVAPWLRGYAPTGVPDDACYHVGALAADAVALHEVLGGDERAVLVGHDWGAAATYAALGASPRRFRRGVTMAVPPFAAMAASFGDLAQLRRSWYMWLLTTPLAEPALAASDLALVTALWRDWSPHLDLAQPRAAEALAAVRTALATPASRQAAVGYYQALFAPPPSDPEGAAGAAGAFAEPTVPVLYLHGTEDGCVSLDAIGDPLAHLAAGSAVVPLEGAGHFLQVEDPAAVVAAVAAFLDDGVRAPDVAREVSDAPEASPPRG